MGKALRRPRTLGLAFIMALMSLALFDVDWLGDGPQCACDAAATVSMLLPLGGM